jgi:class 3 adenylate cyclase
VFDEAIKAVRCAEAICAAAPELGIVVRAGVHTGEIDLAGGRVTGLAVCVGARVGAVAGSGEVLVSRRVRDLVSGSELTFTDRGAHELKGVRGRLALFALGDVRAEPTLPAVGPRMTAGDRFALRVARSAPTVGRFGVRVGNALQRRRATA